MSGLLILSRLVSAAVFMTAALGKIADPAGSRKSLREFGLPLGAAAIAAVLLPIAELAVALALLPAQSAWLGAVGALGLLGVFSAAILAALARGVKPDCHCFGQLHSKPVGPGLIARNITIAMLPAFVVFRGSVQPSIIGWIDEATAGQQLWFALALAAVVVMLAHAWLTLQLVKQGGRALLRLDEIEKRLPQTAVAAQPQALPPPGLRAGADAPAFALPDLNGETISLERLMALKGRVLLLFVQPECGPCGAILKEALAWQARIAAHLRLVIISQGSPQDNRLKLNGADFPHVLLQKQREVAEAYSVPATPSAVIVGLGGKIVSPVAGGAEAIRSLVAGAINDSAADLVSISTTDNASAARIVLPDLDGKLMMISELVEGHSAALLFWNPGCGYCQQMLPELLHWEKHRRNGRRLILISGGTVEDNRKMGLNSPILIDAGFTAGRAFGASGTPSGILLDAEGRVSSKLGVGRDQVMAILTGASTVTAINPQS
jgi:peroxiredoxin/thiol-disulfide isomerase/thioredoxin